MNISLATITAPFTKIIARYHLTLYIVLIAGLLGTAVFMLYQILVTPASMNDEATASAKINGTFNKKTVERIEVLKESSEQPAAVQFPSPRQNPFIE
jgi:hypothetical protein